MQVKILISEDGFSGHEKPEKVAQMIRQHIEEKNMRGHLSYNCHVESSLKQEYPNYMAGYEICLVGGRKFEIDELLNRVKDTFLES